MSCYCHPHFVPVSTLNPTSPHCPVLWKRVVQFNGGAIISIISRSSQCRPVDDFVLWYGSIRSWARPVPRRTYVVGYYATSSTTSARATSNPTRSYTRTMVTASTLGLASTISHSTMSRLPFDPLHMVQSYGYARSYGSVISYVIQHHVVLHYRSMVCLVLSYVVQYGMWLYPTSPRPAILRYARSYSMPSSVLLPALAIYVFRPITFYVLLSASMWSTYQHTRTTWRSGGQLYQQGALTKPSLIL
jgi:hypothetical protein